jgi:ribosomal protein S18 acetylase RimI-like enzyme
MTDPTAEALYEVIEATWPAASRRRLGPWTIRDGQGGGSRVSAATADRMVASDDIPAAEAAMRALGQPTLFMIRSKDAGLDTILAARGYLIKDPVTLYCAPLGAITTHRPRPATTFEVWPPLATQLEIWSDGGIGPGRIAVMERATVPKTTILGRLEDRFAGTAYVGLYNGCAMIHALEIARAHRRQGLAATMTRAAAFWGQSQGAGWLTLVTTQANVAANALYTSLGMAVVGQYHYRIKE